VYGPGRNTHCIITSFIKDALARSISHVPFGADLFRQYVYVDDVVRAVVCALIAGPKLDGRPVNVSGGERLQLGQIAAIVTEILPEAQIEFGHGPDPDDDDEQGPFVLTRAKEILGFEPAVSMREGIARYVDHLKGAHAG
jgi:UDP-glucose 4-epimerase